MIRLRWMNGLEHNYRLSLELVEQKKFRDIETNAFSIDVEPLITSLICLLCPRGYPDIFS